MNDGHPDNRQRSPRNPGTVTPTEDLEPSDSRMLVGVAGSRNDPMGVRSEPRRWRSRVLLPVLLLLIFFISIPILLISS